MIEKTWKSAVRLEDTEIDFLDYVFKKFVIHIYIFLKPLTVFCENDMDDVGIQN